MTKWQVLEAHYKSATAAASAALEQAPRPVQLMTAVEPDAPLPMITLSELREHAERHRQQEELTAGIGRCIRRLHLAWRQRASHADLLELLEALATPACAEPDQEPAQREHPGCIRNAAPPPQRLLSTLLASSVQRNAPNHRACSPIGSSNVAS